MKQVVKHQLLITLDQVSRFSRVFDEVIEFPDASLRITEQFPVTVTDRDTKRFLSVTPVDWTFSPERFVLEHGQDRGAVNHPVFGDGHADDIKQRRKNVVSDNGDVRGGPGSDAGAFHARRPFDDAGDANATLVGMRLAAAKATGGAAKIALEIVFIVAGGAVVAGIPDQRVVGE